MSEQDMMESPRGAAMAGRSGDIPQRRQSSYSQHMCSSSFNYKIDRFAGNIPESDDDYDDSDNGSPSKKKADTFSAPINLYGITSAFLGIAAW